MIFEENFRSDFFKIAKRITFEEKFLIWGFK